MLKNKKVIKLLQEQVNAEFYSAYLYLSFANWLEVEGLPGFANFYKIQAKEEQFHGELFMDYLHAHGILVDLPAIAAPDFKVVDVESILREGLKHEQHVTALIHNIYKEALADADFRTTEMLNWFIKEQLEEEVVAQELIDKFMLLKDSGHGVYLLDQELAGRVWEEPEFSIVD